MKLATVCSGNICRSPMAEYLLKVRAAEAGLPVRTISMGTLGLVGRQAASEAINALSEWDIDLTPHRSQGISLAVLSACDYVFVMEEQHVRDIVRIAPQLRPKLHLMGKWDTQNPADEIDDPVNQSLEVFLGCRDRIDRAVRNFYAQRKSMDRFRR